MAIMIPPILPSDGVSPGEYHIFLRLRDDPLTSNWFVLHSLDVANHRRQIVGEIDFVIVVPEKGVLCLEVKSHTTIRRENGLWYYGNKSLPDPRGPFKQASEAMHSIRKHVTERNRDLGRILFWSAVAFPFAPFAIQSDEWHQWQIIDNHTFRSASIGTIVLNILEQARSFVRTKPTSTWFDPNRAEPTIEQCQTIASILRPNFEFFESPLSRSQRLDEELKYYTSEQFAALDAMEENARVIFQGPAGTGKTMLAIEAARRSAVAKRKVLLLCFNSFLGTYLTEQTAALQPQVTTSTLHSHMLKLAQLPAVQQERQFWEDQLPTVAIERLLADSSDSDVYDELIIDEAQDILREPYLDFLDLSLRGGIASGRWRLFGDFEKQAIYGSANLSLDEFRKKRGSNAPVYSLRTNCRNTPRIVSLVHLLGGLNPHYSRTLRPDNRVEPEFWFYTNHVEQQNLLIQVLAALVHEGFSNNEIVVLSPKASKACASTISIAPWNDLLQPYGTSREGAIRYCSIQSYKGLESTVVVVTDIERISTGHAQALFYVAITRALYRLILLIHDSAQIDIISLLASEGTTSPGKISLSQH